MRAAVLGMLFVIAEAGAHAGGAAVVAPEPKSLAIALPDQPRFARPPQAPEAPLLGPEREAPSSTRGFSIGPFHAEGITNEFGRGRHPHPTPHYRLEGVTVLGGAVGGSVDGRGGMVTLDWHTGQ
jgi:hypothetical protein